MICYLDCVGGLAGDMLLGALLDAGAPEEELRALPDRLRLEAVELRVERVARHGVGALHVTVLSGAADHPRRSWRSIREQLDRSDLEPDVHDRAVAVFQRLAEAEGQIHGVSPEEIHFHELGAVDTLIDIVGAVTLLDALEITRLTCSPLPMGRGTVRAAHGVLPIPAPATTALLTGAPVFGVELEGELVTPTGAALASTLAADWGAMPAMTLGRVGYGAGSSDFPDLPNLVRAVLGSEVESPGIRREIVLIETNLDDLPAELVPDAVERCFQAGALDVWTAPAAMKKGRPGIVLSALARPEAEVDLARAMLEETTALGVRVAHMQRHELDREERTVEVSGRPVRVKVGRLNGRVVNVAPEHDDCAAVARELGVPVKSVWAEAMATARGVV